MIYLDYSATTPVSKEVLDSYIKVTTDYIGNPNSLHSLGEKSNELLKSATKQISDLLNINEKEIIYTSGATEANNLALVGYALKNIKKGKTIIVSKLEHPSIYGICDYLKNFGFKIIYVENDENGLIDFEDLKRKITDDTLLVSIVAVNSEMGIRQPLKTIRQVIKKQNEKTVFHSDMTQAVGKVNINLKDVDMASISGHKIYGPKGEGGLFLRKGVRIGSFIHGGAQENGKRAGTENLAGIVGFGAAAELARKNLDNHIANLTKIRNHIIKRVTEEIPDVTVNGSLEHRHPGNANFTFKYIEGESILILLDSMGVSVSTGSACSSKSLEPSHVLTAIGVDVESVHGSIRMTVGDMTTMEDADYAVDCLKKVVARLREISSLC